MVKARVEASGFEFSAQVYVGGVLEVFEKILLGLEAIGEVFVSVDGAGYQVEVGVTELTWDEAKYGAVGWELGGVHPSGVTIGVEEDGVLYAV